ncbi:MAG: CBS domain-containing protein [Melioribacteraceae bacterium]|nr:CBS domain-containing protein [Melioribacteraceae bacterium]
MKLTAEDILKEKGNEIVSVTPDTTIADAIKKMNSNKIGAVLVVDVNGYIGIWTERDLLKNLLIESFDVKTSLVKDYMTTNLVYAKYDDSLYQLLDKFLGRRIRHLLVEKEGEYIGFLSTGDVMRSGLVLKSKELEEMNAILSWEYYENWNFEPKK